MAPGSRAMMLLAAAAALALFAPLALAHEHGTVEQGHVYKCPHAEHVAPVQRRAMAEIKSTESAHNSFHGARRVLQGSDPTPIRIHAEYQYDDSDAELAAYLRVDLMPRVINYLRRIISIRTPVAGPTLKLPRTCQSVLTTDPTKCVFVQSLRDCFKAKRNASLYDDYSTCQGAGGSCQTYEGGAGTGTPADYVLYVTIDGSDASCQSSGAIAAGGFCDLDPLRQGRPVSGTVNFCPSELSRMKALGNDGFLFDTAVHEFLHGIAFDSTLFSQFVGVDGSAAVTAVEEDEGGSRETRRIVTPKVVEAGRALWACDDLTGVPLENDGGRGTAGIHWESRAVGADLMLPTSRSSERQIMSQLTMAMIEDTGWFVPNYALAGVEQFGAGRGCAFLDEACEPPPNATDWSLPTALRPEFCSSQDPATKPLSCMPDLSAFGACYPTPLGPCERPGPLVIGGEMLSCGGVGNPADEASYLSLFGQSFGPGSRCLEMVVDNPSTKITGTSNGENMQMTYQIEQALNGAGCFNVRCEGTLNTIIVRINHVIRSALGDNVGIPSAVDLECTPGKTLDLSSLKQLGIYGGGIVCPADPNAFCSSIGCPNDCSGVGQCVGGACKCFPGHYGPDCAERDCEMDGCPRGGVCSNATGACAGRRVTFPPPPRGFEGEAPPTPPLPPRPPPFSPYEGELQLVYGNVQTVGPAVGCRVFMDGDNDGEWAGPDREPAATTDERGFFTISGASVGDILRTAVGGDCRDGITGLRLEYSLAAFVEPGQYPTASQTVLTPLTTVAVSMFRVDSARGSEGIGLTRGEGSVKAAQTSLGVEAGISSLNPWYELAGDAGGRRRRRMLGIFSGGGQYDAAKEAYLVGAQIHVTIEAAMWYIGGVGVWGGSGITPTPTLATAAVSALGALYRTATTTTSLESPSDMARAVEFTSSYALLAGVDVKGATLYDRKFTAMADLIVDLNKRLAALRNEPSAVVVNEAARLGAYVQTNLVGYVYKFGMDSVAANDATARDFELKTRDSAIGSEMLQVVLPGSVFPSPPSPPPPAPPGGLIDDLDNIGKKASDTVMIFGGIGAGIGSLIIAFFVYCFCCRKGSRAAGVDDTFFGDRTPTPAAGAPARA